MSRRSTSPGCTHKSEIVSRHWPGSKKRSTPTSPDSPAQGGPGLESGPRRSAICGRSPAGRNPLNPQGNQVGRALEPVLTLGATQTVGGDGHASTLRRPDHNSCRSDDGRPVRLRGQVPPSAAAARGTSVRGTPGRLQSSSTGAGVGPWGHAQEGQGRIAAQARGSSLDEGANVEELTSWSRAAASTSS